MRRTPRETLAHQGQLLDDVPGELDAAPPELETTLAADDALTSEADEEAPVAALEDRLALLAPSDVAALLPPEELPANDALDATDVLDAKAALDANAALDATDADEDSAFCELESPPDDEPVFTPPVVGGTGQAPSVPSPRPTPTSTMTA